MYLIYSITLIILFLILMLLWKEEKKTKKNITYGLASKYWILKEKRKFIRFGQEIKIRYNFLDKPSDSFGSKTANISKKGLCLVTYEKLKDKSYIDLYIDLPGFSKPVRLTGQVVWIRNIHTHDEKNRRLFYVGIRFHKISPESEAKLLTHLNNLKPDPA